MDTNSLILDKPLSKKYVGNEIGKFKLEHLVSKGYFISSKTYCLIIPDGTNIIKAKGIISKSLSEKDFIKLLNAKDVKATKINYKKGGVSIGSK